MFLKTLRGGSGKFLESIDLSYNEIGDDGVFSLAKAFETNQLPNLKHLVLREINAGPISLLKLLKSFQLGNQLEYLDISGNALFAKSKNEKKTTYYSSKVLMNSLAKSPLHLNNAVQSVTDIFGKWTSEPKRNIRVGVMKKKIGQKHARVRNLQLHKDKRRETISDKALSKKLENEQCARSLKSIINVNNVAPRLRFFGLIKVGLTQKQKESLSKRSINITTNSPQAMFFL